jgi:hypothetical protein
MNRLCFVIILIHFLVIAAVSVEYIVYFEKFFDGD